jgi:hypothetical protein
VSDELTRLREENEELAVENAELKGLTQGGWWRRGAVVLAMTTIVALTVPVTSAVWAHFEAERDLALQAAQHEHALTLEAQRQIEALRAAYLDPTKPPAEQLKALRLLLAMGPGSEVKAWAEAELARGDRSGPSQPVSARPGPVAIEPPPPPPPVAPPVPPAPSVAPARPARDLVRPVRAPLAAPSAAQMALKEDPY